MTGIEAQVRAICGIGPQGNPAEIRACAEEFRTDTRQVAEAIRQLGSHHSQLRFEGPAAERLDGEVDSNVHGMQVCVQLLRNIAATLDIAASQLESDQRAHRQRVAETRQELINQERARAAR